MSKSLSRLFIATLALFVVSATPLLAHSAILIEGHMVIGTYAGGGPDEVRMGKGDDHLYSRDEIVAVVIGKGKVVARAKPMIAGSDLLELRDETSIEGRYAGGDKNEMRMEVDGEVKAYPLDTILRLTFGHSEPDVDEGPASEPGESPSDPN